MRTDSDSSLRTTRWPWASVAAEERAHVRVLVGLGFAVYVTHRLYLPPGWLWSTVPWYLAGVLGVVAAGAGFRGFDIAPGALATSAPGLALALRSEFWPIHVGCFPEADTADRCLLPPPNETQFLLEQLSTSVAFVLVVCGVGYAIGRGLGRLGTAASD